MTGVFEGIVLPTGDSTRLEFGAGDAEMTLCASVGKHLSVLANPAAVVPDHRRIS